MNRKRTAQAMQATYGGTVIGGFHDINTFRAETGLSANDISDADVMKVIVEDAQEQLKHANKQHYDNKMMVKSAEDREREAKRQLEEAKQERDRARQERDKLDRERFGTLFGKSPFVSTDSLSREILKRDIMDELEREKERRLLTDAILNPKVIVRTRPAKRAKSKARSKSRAKSHARNKSKKSKTAKKK